MGTGSNILRAVDNCRPKLIRDGEYKMNSPLRASSDSGAFTLLISPDDEHGAFHDFVSGQSGSLYELAKLLNVSVPKSADNKSYAINTKRDYDGLADYAAAHFVPESAFLSAGWEQCKHDNRDALRFPTSSGNRIRFIDGGKPSYKAEFQGYAACLYGTKRIHEIANKYEQKAIVIANGEASTVVAQYYGVPAVCQTSGEKAWTPQHVRMIKDSWEGLIIIALDCDDTGRRAASEIAYQFGNMARVVDLGFTEGGDLADFCGLWREGAYDELLRRANVAVKVESQLTPSELILNALDNLNNTIRKQDRSKTELAGAVEKTKAVLDRVSMGLAAPVVVSFNDLAMRADILAMERRAGSNNDNVPRLRTGISKIDKVLGELAPEMYVVYGATGAGKSWLLVSFARSFLRFSPGLIVSTEMTPLAWFNRLLASSSHSDYKKFKSGKSEDYEWDKIQSELKRLGMCSADILDHSAPTPSLIRNAYLDGQDKGRGYEWIMIDSASKMAGGGDGVYNNTFNVADGIQDMWRSFNVPIFVSNQVGRDVAERPRGKKRPMLEDAYGGGRTEQNAGVVIGLYNHHYYVKRELEPEDPALPEGVIATQFLKMRDEYDGDAPSIRLAWTGAGYGEYAGDL